MSTPYGPILIVEDVPNVLELLEVTLRFKGYAVVTARNGEEALEVISRQKPVLIITDILMPKMDGFNLVHRLRISPEYRTIPVVFLSATYVTPEDKVFAHSIGVNRFIEKPVDLVKFLPIIERILSQGDNVALEPLSEAEFYEGYRKRLELKLKQKMIQISRDEHILTNLTDEEKASIKGSLSAAISEREEIQQLLNQVRELAEKNKELAENNKKPE